MKTLKVFLILLNLSLAITTAVGCGDDDDDGSGGRAGSAGSAESDGSAGSAGQAVGAGSGGTEADASTGEEPDASTGEQPDASQKEPKEPEIAGTYVDNFDISHEITDETWTQSSEYGTFVFEISEFSDEDGYIIAQNGEGNGDSAGLWSRFDWTEKDGELWFCQSVFDADTAQEALDADPADDSDPASGGCGGFAWSKLQPPPEPLDIAGSYLDNFDISHEITDETWTQSSEYGTFVFEISEFSNEDGYVIAQNGEGNGDSAGLWSRFDWTEHDGSLWFCQGVFDAETEEEALNAKRAVDADPANGGCGGFAWSKLTPE